MPWYSQFYEDNPSINKETKTDDVKKTSRTSTSGLYNIGDGKTYFVLTDSYNKLEKDIIIPKNGVLVNYYTLDLNANVTNYGVIINITGATSLDAYGSQNDKSGNLNNYGKFQNNGYIYNKKGTDFRLANVYTNRSGGLFNSGTFFNNGIIQNDNTIQNITYDGRGKFINNREIRGLPPFTGGNPSAAGKIYNGDDTPGHVSNDTFINNGTMTFNYLFNRGTFLNKGVINIASPAHGWLGGGYSSIPTSIIQPAGSGGGQLIGETYESIAKNNKDGLIVQQATDMGENGWSYKTSYAHKTPSINYIIVTNVVMLRYYSNELKKRILVNLDGWQYRRCLNKQNEKLEKEIKNLEFDESLSIDDWLNN